MATISLIGGEDGNLATRADVPDHGAANDSVTVLNETAARSYNIFTFAGNDTVNTSGSNALNLNAAILGVGDDTFTGGNASDTVYDGSGTDTVNLGGGKDMIRVSAGNDTYDGGDGNDYVSFGFQSFDGIGPTVNNTVGVKCDLALITRQDFGIFGKDIIKNFESLDGSDGADVFHGTAAANALFGMSGNDSLYGRAGNDKLNGGGGNDFLAGGLGKDLLIGESGSDTINCGGADGTQDIIQYLGMTDSPVVGADVVYGFTTGGTLKSDRIDISLMDAKPATAGVNEAFLFRTSGGFHSSGGEIRLVPVGPDVVVLIDTDSDIAAEMRIVLKAVHGLTAHDFIL